MFGLPVIAVSWQRSVVRPGVLELIVVIGYNAHEAVGLLVRLSADCILVDLHWLYTGIHMGLTRITWVF